MRAAYDLTVSALLVKSAAHGFAGLLVSRVAQR